MTKSNCGNALPIRRIDKMPSLYAVVLGGNQTGSRLGEDHEVVFVVAEDEPEARAKAKSKWSGETTAGLHIDSIAEIDIVDGFRIQLAPEGEGDCISVNQNSST
jgi:hypothetical protein